MITGSALSSIASAPRRCRSSGSGEIELKPLPLPLGGDPVVHIHQRRAARRDHLVRERAAEEFEGRRARLALDRLLGRRAGRDVFHQQRLRRDQTIAVRRAEGVDEIVLQLRRQSVRHADRARLVDGDALRIPRRHPGFEMRREPFLAIQLARVVERLEMCAEVRAEGGRLQPAVAGVMKKVGVAVAVPAGDAVAAEQFEGPGPARSRGSG